MGAQMKLHFGLLTALGIGLAVNMLLAADSAMTADPYVSKQTCFKGWAALFYDWQQGWAGALAAGIAGFAAWATIRATRQAARDEIVAAQSTLALSGIDAARKNLQQHLLQSRRLRRQYSHTINSTDSLITALTRFKLLSSVEQVEWQMTTRNGRLYWMPFNADEAMLQKIEAQIEEVNASAFRVGSLVALDTFPDWMRRNSSSFDKQGFDGELLAGLDNVIVATDAATRPLDTAPSPGEAVVRHFTSWNSMHALLKYIDLLQIKLKQLDERAAPFENWFRAHGAQAKE